MRLFTVLSNNYFSCLCCVCCVAWFNGMAAVLYGTSTNLNTHTHSRKHITLRLRQFSIMRTKRKKKNKRRQCNPLHLYSFQGKKKLIFRWRVPNNLCLALQVWFPWGEYDIKWLFHSVQTQDCCKLQVELNNSSDSCYYTASLWFFISE